MCLVVFLKQFASVFTGNMHEPSDVDLLQSEELGMR